MVEHIQTNVSVELTGKKNLSNQTSKNNWEIEFPVTYSTEIHVWIIWTGFKSEANHFFINDCKYIHTWKISPVKVDI